FGGNGNDTITGDGDPNVIFGDHGHMQYISGAADVTSLHMVESISFAQGGVDSITANGGDDFIFGGARGDTIDAGDGSNLVFGDYGYVDYLADLDVNDPAPAHDIDVVSSIPSATGLGGNDTITTGLGEDIIVGGAGNDTLTSGSTKDLVFGDNVKLTGAPF